MEIMPNAYGSGYTPTAPASAPAVEAGVPAAQGSGAPTDDGGSNADQGEGRDARGSDRQASRQTDSPAGGPSAKTVDAVPLGEGVVAEAPPPRAAPPPEKPPAERGLAADDVAVTIQAQEAARVDDDPSPAKVAQQQQALESLLDLTQSIQAENIQTMRSSFLA